MSCGFRQILYTREERCMAYHLILRQLNDMSNMNNMKCCFSSSFKRALKKLDDHDLLKLLQTIHTLIAEETLPVRYANHKVKGNLKY
ncbi:hypothetical protein HHE06_06280 [Helicobacter heilmannii]|nr:hypothetical protein NHP21011_10650 [Helicobacter heilmannii]CRF49862.1 hypothetical protein HHE03_15400 [Helicobacter heilmannii]CRF50782.1 hypothetical protein HHE06_06280 [Helicobacter heilmannii]